MLSGNGFVFPHGYPYFEMCAGCLAFTLSLPKSQEEKNGKKVTDEKVVKLLAQLPPIDKMDAGLAVLAHVE